MTIKKEKKRLWILYYSSTRSTLTDEQQQENDEAAQYAWPHSFSSESSFELRGLTRKEPKDFFKDSREVSEELYNAKEAFVVWVRYSTGDTFGYTSGCFDIVDILRTESAAKAMKKAIEDDSYKKGEYTPWRGYFESLESCEYEKFTIQGELK